MAQLSPYRLGKARDLYNLFNVFNSLSWQFLVGNVITLFALRVGANSTFIGTMSAVLYVSFFFLPIGKILANRFAMVKIYSVAWISRAIGMLPVLFVPFVFAAGYRDAALMLILLGVFLFHMIRGIGMIGNNPILSLLASGPDRGSYMTQIQIINSAVGMFAGFVIALLLGREPPLLLYAIIIAAGIGFGIISGILMRNIPEPDKVKEEKSKKIFEIIREAMADKSLRSFIFILLLVALVSGVSRTFLVVYCRGIFNQSDGMVSLYAVFGGLGVLLVGFVIKFFVDKIGAKPIFTICIVLGLISLVPVVFFPVSLSDNFTTVTLYLTFLFFMLNFSWLGAEGVMQTYFLGLVPSEKMMDMGILYFFGFGVAGAGGSFLSGLLLDVSAAVSGSAIVSFRILYIILIALSLVILALVQKLVPLGALPFWGALEVMFSYRDLKAITLLDKLNKTSGSDEEAAILGALTDTPSRLAVQGLLTRAKSPRLTVRMESINALDAMDTLNESAKQALLEDILNNTYTTAYRSAQALGNHGVFEAIPILRNLAVSSDYMLAGEAMVALAKLRDISYREHIESIILETQNPRLKIMGVEACGIFGFPDSIPILLDIFRASNPPPYLRDEVVLSMASILDIQNKFYPLLIKFLADTSLAPTLAMDEAEAAYEHYLSVHVRKLNPLRRSKTNPGLALLDSHAKAFQPAVNEYIHNSDGRQLSRWIQELPEELVHAIIQTVLSETVLDDEFHKFPRLKLLIVNWTAHELRLWTNKRKTEL